MSKEDDILSRVSDLFDEAFDARLESLAEIIRLTVGSYFSDLSEQDILSATRVALGRHAHTTIQDFMLRLVTKNDRRFEEDFELLLDIERSEGNHFADLRSVYGLFAFALSDTPS